MQQNIYIKMKQKSISVLSYIKFHLHLINLLINKMHMGKLQQIQNEINFK